MTLRSVSPTEEEATGAISGIGFAYSLDEGTTWAAAANVDETTANLFRYGTREVTPAVTSSGDVAAAKGKPFNYRIEASSNPTHFGAHNLPSWMTLNSGTGVLSGTPTAVGTSTFKVFAYNSYAAAIKDATVKVIDLDNWKYSMDLTLKYTGAGDVSDATKPGQGSVTYSAGNNSYPGTRAFDDKGERHARKMVGEQTDFFESNLDQV